MSGNYFLIKDGFYYIPSKDYFNGKTFISVNLQTIQQKGISNLVELNKPFKYNNNIIVPSDIINFMECKIGIITKNEINKIIVNYEPSKNALEKTIISCKHNLSEYNNYSVDIGDNKAFDFIYKGRWENGEIIHIKYFSNKENIKFKFNKNTTISNIYINNKKYGIYERIKNKSIKIKFNLLNIYITFEKSYDRVIINPLYKEIYNYNCQSLQEAKND